MPPLVEFNGAIEILLIGYAIGVVPKRDISRLFIAFIGKKVGVKPRQIRRFDNAVSGENNDNNQEETDA